MRPHRDTMPHVSAHLANARQRPRTVDWKRVPNVRQRVDDKRRELEEQAAIRRASDWYGEGM